MLCFQAGWAPGGLEQLLIRACYMLFNLSRREECCGEMATASAFNPAHNGPQGVCRLPQGQLTCYVADTKTGSCESQYVDLLTGEGWASSSRAIGSREKPAQTMTATLLALSQARVVQAQPSAPPPPAATTSC